MTSSRLTMCDHSTTTSSHRQTTPRSRTAQSPLDYLSSRRREREELLTSLWSHVWTKRQSPEWRPRRASVAACQRRYSSNNASPSKLAATGRRLTPQYLQPQQPLDQFSPIAVYETLTAAEIRKHLNRRLYEPPTTGEANEVGTSVILSKQQQQQQQLACDRVGDDELDKAMVGCGCSAEGGGSSGETLVMSSEQAVAAKPTGRRRRVPLEGSSSPGSRLASEVATLADTRQVSSLDSSPAPLPPLAEPQTATCCSTSTAASSSSSSSSSLSSSCSLSTISLSVGGGAAAELEPTGRDPAALETEADESQRTALAMSEKLQLQDKQRKSLIYSMALKQMISAPETDTAKIGGGGGGESGEVKDKECCSATTCNERSNCKTAVEARRQLRLHLQQHLYTLKQQQTVALGSPKTVSDNSSLIDHLPAKPVSTTTPLTCCHAMAGDRREQRRPKSVRVERSAPSGQMFDYPQQQQQQPPTKAQSSSSRFRKRISDAGSVGRNPYYSVAELDDSVESSSLASNTTIIETKPATRETGEQRAANEQATRIKMLAHEQKPLRASRCRSGSGDCSTQSIDSSDSDEANLSEEEEEKNFQINSEMHESALLMHTKAPQREDNLNRKCSLPAANTDSAAGSASDCLLGCEQRQDLNSDETQDENLELESLIIESWLDDHPSFVRDYFMRKASRQLIDDWLVTHTTKFSTTSPQQLSSQLDLPSAAASSNSASCIYPNGSQQQHNILQQQANHYQPQNIRVHPNAGFGRPARSGSGQSGHATPVRKISATDFESRTGSGFLRPMVSTTPDGRPTFLSQPAPPTPDGQDEEEDSRLVVQRLSHKARNSESELEPKSIGAITSGNELQCKSNSTSGESVVAKAEETGDARGHQLDDVGCREVELIFELVKNICNDLDIKTLLHKILKNIAVLINADKSSLFLVCGPPGDPNRHLVSQLFNVDQDSEVNTADPNDCITIPWGTGLVGYVAESGQSVNIENCYEDPRFTDTIDQRTGYVTKHMLCAPILDKRNEIVGVAQVINKRDGNPFSKCDELKFKRYLQFCGIGLRNAQSYENCQLENRRNQVLLDLARMVFEEQSTIEQVVYRIMLHTQSLLECQRCQVLLIDDGSDDLEQLLQLSSSALHHNMSMPNANNSTTATAAGAGADDESQIPKPEWRPQCNHAAAETSIHHDRLGDNNNNSNDTNGPMLRVANRHRAQGGATTAQQSPKLFSLVFDLECDGNDLVMHSNKESGAAGAGKIQGFGVAEKLERRFPINIGITGYVAMTGETLNIEDAHQNDRFDPSVDQNSDFKHKSILCMPIRNGQRQIIGVSQLINKKNGRPFNKNDEDLFEAFAIFCGLGIHNTLMYEKVLKIMAKQRVTFEVLSYHATAPLEEAKKLNSEIIPSCFALNLTSLKFNDFSLDEQFMLKSCLRFFLDLDLIRRFQIDQLVFCNWILSVQKNYRKVTYHPIVGGNGLKASPVRYHNWRHAFNVSQMMFAILIVSVG